MIIFIHQLPYWHSTLNHFSRIAVQLPLNISTCRYKSFEKAYSLAIDINDADLFMILHKCSKAHGLLEIAEESMKKADEIYAAEEDESHRT